MATITKTEVDKFLNKNLKENLSKSKDAILDHLQKQFPKAEISQLKKFNTLWFKQQGKEIKNKTKSVVKNVKAKITKPEIHKILDGDLKANLKKSKESVLNILKKSFPKAETAQLKRLQTLWYNTHTKVTEKAKKIKETKIKAPISKIADTEITQDVLVFIKDVKTAFKSLLESTHKKL